MQTPTPDQQSQAEALIFAVRVRRWNFLQWVAWLLLTGALAWFLTRELMPRTIGDEGRTISILLMGAAFAGGAMLVGGKLALAPVGKRPALRELAIMLFGPPFAMLFLLHGWNSLGGGAEMRFVAPVVSVSPASDPSERELTTLTPRGATEVIRLDVAEAAGYRRGQCMELRYREGSLGLPVELGRRPVACPAEHGTTAPQGPLLVSVGENGRWRWSMPSAGRGPKFEEWFDQMQKLALQSPDAVNGRTILFTVLLEPDGRIAAARAEADGLMPSIGDQLSATLVGQKDVVIPPAEAPMIREAMWVALPERVTFNVIDDLQVQGNNSELSP